MARRTLTDREVRLVLIGSIIFLSIVTVPFARSFSHDYREVRRELVAATHRLEQVRSLRETILTERKAQRLVRARLDGQGNQPGLYDFVNGTLASMNLQDRMRLQKRLGSEKQEAVELTLNSVSLKELVDFLHSLNAEGRLIAVQSVRYIRPASGDRGLDTTMVLTAPKR